MFTTICRHYARMTVKCGNGHYKWLWTSMNSIRYGICHTVVMKITTLTNFARWACTDE